MPITVIRNCWIHTKLVALNQREAANQEENEILSGLERQVAELGPVRQ